ncbi:hypothetical protein BFW01_g4515 [Lasiodiplodia theobromae]|uniref:Seed maturation protein pm25-like protein n=1 Tax=Lasiodiplodia theobromae TaxID=45133 RepID=UPI0015C2EACB|nr:Seed maturation protein pm25-like protein [Lasiodiplodia theobromae]KAF4537093.1 Seed maturation protein pm25-like protein [Lasiodiplodia theobromae]KAF9633621.1 hypothetical protein BFW01_g4515 [Lasiodiplodia theobromae]
MSAQPDNAAPVSKEATETPKESAPALPAEAKPFGESFEKTVAEGVAKLKEEPEHITHEDAARVQSAEHKVLGFRPPPGSAAAQVQSMSDNTDNLRKVTEAAQKKFEDDPASVTPEDIKRVLSAERKVYGGTLPKGSIPAATLPTVDTKDQESSATEKPALVVRGRRQSIVAAEQSPAAREHVYQAVAEEMKDKLEKHPEDITKEDASLMRRVDTRAHGATEKGSITAQVQREAAKHEDAKHEDAKHEDVAKPVEIKEDKVCEETAVAGDAEPCAPAETAVKAEKAAETDRSADGA